MLICEFRYLLNLTFVSSLNSSYGVGPPGTNLLLNTGSTGSIGSRPSYMIGPGMTIQSTVYATSDWYLPYMTSENPATTDTPNLYSCFYVKKKGWV